MSGPPDFADELLAATACDHLVWTKLVNDAEVHDSSLGFHAQQVVEKGLNAVLARAQVAFRRTHDIAELLDTLADAGLAAPPHAAHLDELNPYAVQARYGWAPTLPLDRALTGRWLVDVLAWAQAGPKPR